MSAQDFFARLADRLGLGLDKLIEAAGGQLPTVEAGPPPAPAAAAADAELSDADQELAARLGRHAHVVAQAGIVCGMTPDQIARRLLAVRHLDPDQPQA